MRTPVHEIRFGLIKVSIFLDKTKVGDRYSCTAVRLYKDGTWKSSAIFGRDDLLLVSKAIDHAHTWIFNALQRNPAGDAQQIEQI